jgi:hypothetical protein
MRRYWLILTFSLALAGCAQVPGGGDVWIRTEVYFGLSRPDGGQVTDAEWRSFMDEVVTPSFPAGLSVMDVAGQWQNATGKIDREASKMLVLLHPLDPAIEAKIDEIRATYCKRFHQEAVMKVTTRVRVAF